VIEPLINQISTTNPVDERPRNVRPLYRF